MNNWMLRIVAGIVCGALLIGVKFYMGTQRRADASREVLAALREELHQMPGYEVDPGYIDWVAGAGHQAVFSDSYNIDIGSRYRAGHDSMDLDQYFEDVFRWMINQANQDQRKKVAEAMQKYLEDPEAAEEDVKEKPPENPFLKK